MRYIDVTKPEQGRATTRSVRENFEAIKEQLDGSLKHVYTGTYFVCPFARTAVYYITPRIPRSSDMYLFTTPQTHNRMRPRMDLRIEGAYKGDPRGRMPILCCWALLTATFMGVRTAWRGIVGAIDTPGTTPYAFELEEMGRGLYPHYLEHYGEHQYWFGGGYWERTISERGRNPIFIQMATFN